MTKDSELSKK